MTSAVTFQFDGKAYRGFDTDTLASALLRNGVSVVGRSFKFHRPRGVIGSGAEECNAIVKVGEGPFEEVNVRATQVQLYDGLVAESQNCWPSAHSDALSVLGIFSRLLPAGFYLKTFMWPSWHTYEKLIRNSAGLGRISGQADPDVYVKRFVHTDVLIVGAGPAGIMAALAAAYTGADVLLLDEQAEIGGMLLGEAQFIDGLPAADWLAQKRTELASLKQVTFIKNCSAQGYYDGNFVSAVEQVTSAGQNTANLDAISAAPKQRLWKIRAARVVLATGAIERPLVFPNNDRPGVMLCSAARKYAYKHDVGVGKNAVVFTNNDSAYEAAFEMHKSGVNISAIVDVRPESESACIRQANAIGIKLFCGAGVVGVRGKKAVKGLEIASLNSDGTAFSSKRSTHLDCDLLCMSGGWNPVVHLFSQAGGVLDFNERKACFEPASCGLDIYPAGASNGAFSLAGCLIEGAKYGEMAAQSAGFSSAKKPAPPFIEETEKTPLQPYWQTPPFKGKDTSSVQFVDFLHDVTVADINLSAKEGFKSVEHLKRYTATGMAVDQGKTSNINALAIMGQATGRAVAEVGTTKFRPPYQPVTIGALAGNTVGALATVYRQLPVSWHQTTRAKLEDHSGWMRPAAYPKVSESEEQAIIREVTSAREGVALFDSSTLGKIEVIGADAGEFLNRLYINNVKSLKVGKVRYGMMLNENGIIIDDGVFACLAENHYLVTTSSAGALDIYFWMQEWLQCEWPDLDVEVVPVTAQWSTLTLSGPKARTVLEKLDLNIDLSTEAFPHMSVRGAHLGQAALRVFRVSFTGEASYELNVPSDYAQSLWALLLELGESENITPLGMEALNVLRIEKGFLEVGVDTDGETTPLSVGWAVPISKKKADFIGRRSLSRSHNLRPDAPYLVGIRPVNGMLEVPVGIHLKNKSGTVIGHVTSSCMSPTLGTSIAMAMVTDGEALKGQVLQLDISGKLHACTVTALGFYDPKGERFNA